ncbi:glycosyltransferase [Niveispirillum sp. SYP-B3756]|uniref:glycosyltransferase family 4 protein n=1 Tax=Niveispirillum sp. SYP-B3756 TaxID=2662178 RepID=UPI001290DEFD|nr:glycosyltransferase family 4 protein [Niveispirillum sp. SYP-B3756]MQP67358.1 glycosyltransferase [Niveispirillum sp. SYP-B3756]
MSTAPRIAYIINSVEGGGAALPVPAVTKVMRDAGASVRVFALTRRDGRALPPMQAAGLDPLVREGGTGDHGQALRWLHREVRAWGATHLWTSLSRATILGLLLGPYLGLPVICWQHAAFLKPWNRRLMRLLQSRATLWVGDSASVSALTRQRLAVGEDRLMTWPIFAADPAQPVAPPWQPGQTLELGSLGRLHPVKGYEGLIEALALLRQQGFTPPCPIRLTLAGEGDERERLAALAAQGGVADIVLPGYVDQPQQFLAGLHLYLQPSRSEGFCIAAHEAMVAGLPVLASAVGEIPFSVQEGITGHTVPPRDVPALADRLGRMLAEPGRLHAMGSAARAHILDRFALSRFNAAGQAIMQRISGTGA